MQINKNLSPDQSAKLEKTYHRLGLLHEHITDELGALDPIKHDVLIRHKLSKVKDIYNERKAIYDKLKRGGDDRAN